MLQATVEYVEKNSEGGWRISGSRVSLDSVVHRYREGESPEGIVEDFPSLSVEQVYGTIAFYLRNRAEVDEYLTNQSERWEQLRQASMKNNGPLLERIRAERIAHPSPEAAP